MIPQERRASYESLVDHMIEDGAAVTRSYFIVHFDTALMTSHAMVKVHRAGAYVQYPKRC